MQQANTNNLLNARQQVNPKALISTESENHPDYMSHGSDHTIIISKIQHTMSDHTYSGQLLEQKQFHAVLPIQQLYFISVFRKLEQLEPSDLTNTNREHLYQQIYSIVLYFNTKPARTLSWHAPGSTQPATLSSHSLATRAPHTAHPIRAPSYAAPNLVREAQKRAERSNTARISPNEVFGSSVCN